MKVVCFRGLSGSGKSTTIKRIFTEIFGFKIFKGFKKDFSLIFNHNGLKIGICSLGDIESILNEYLKPLKKEKCDVILCVCRTKGKTLGFIKREFGNGVKYIDCIKLNRNNKKGINLEIKKNINQFIKWAKKEKLSF